jgi:hypothetical protein
MEDTNVLEGTPILLVSRACRISIPSTRQAREYEEIPVFEPRFPLLLDESTHANAEILYRLSSFLSL